MSHRKISQKEINTPLIDQTAYDGGVVSATRPPSPLSGCTPTSGQPGLVTNLALPSSEETLQLIRRYFYETGLLFPYIHPPTFLETYDEFKNNAKKVRRTWIGLLSIMLAMAKVTAVSGHAPAESRIKESTVYYRQALNLCRGEMLRGTTLEVGGLILSSADLSVVSTDLPCSAVSPTHGPISPRDTEIRPGVDCTRTGRQGRAAARATFEGCLPGVLPS